MIRLTLTPEQERVLIEEARGRGITGTELATEYLEGLVVSLQRNQADRDKKEVIAALENAEEATRLQVRSLLGLG